MSRILRRSIQSARDYEQIYQYIAKDDPNAAANLLRLFDEKLALLLEHPRLGEARPKVGKGVRTLVVQRHYVLVYRERANAIELIRVLHTARSHRARRQ